MSSQGLSQSSVDVLSRRRGVGLDRADGVVEFGYPWVTGDST